LRAAITGVSAVVRPDGSIASLLGVDEEGVLRAEVAGRTERTLYSRAPWAPPLVAFLLWAPLRVAGRLRSGRL
jgi:apolipoprotein N-acyltransferase